MSPTAIRLLDVFFAAFGLAFLCHPAIFFGLRRRLKPNIPVPVACVLSILLGWAWLVSPMFIDAALPEAIRGRWCQEGPGAIAALLAGWVVSGFLLLLWSPLLVAFAQWTERRRAAGRTDGRP